MSTRIAYIQGLSFSATGMASLADAEQSAFRGLIVDLLIVLKAQKAFIDPSEVEIDGYPNDQPHAPLTGTRLEALWRALTFGALPLAVVQLGKGFGIAHADIKRICSEVFTAENLPNEAREMWGEHETGMSDVSINAVSSDRKSSPLINVLINDTRSNLRFALTPPILRLATSFPSSLERPTIILHKLKLHARRSL